jgi:predicted MPP superfamily phosphohydrolase
MAVITTNVAERRSRVPTYDEEMGVPNAPRSSSRLTRRSFLKLSALAAGGLALYAAEIARHELSVEQHALHLPRLPETFRGMRVVQISDFHYAEFSEGYFLRDMVERVNRLRPDMVLLTGDFVSFGPLPKSFARRHAAGCAEILSKIECPLRYAIMGNHDCSVGEKYVIGPLRENGIPVLLNQAVPLERGGQRLWLAGLDSADQGKSRPEQAIPRAGGEPVIVLAHEPDILPEIAKYKADLVLSGHTHGGQVRLPFLPPLVLPPLGKKYVQGLFHYGDTQLYVNRGIGTVGLPIRLNCPPEITVLTLT